MTAQEILTLISQYGFPIIVCLLLMWYIYKQQAKSDETIKSLTKVVEKNTEAIERLSSKNEKE